MAEGNPGPHIPGGGEGHFEPSSPPNVGGQGQQYNQGQEIDETMARMREQAQQAAQSQSQMSPGGVGREIQSGRTPTEEELRSFDFVGAAQQAGIDPQALVNQLHQEVERQQSVQNPQELYNQFHGQQQQQPQQPQQPPQPPPQMPFNQQQQQAPPPPQQEQPQQQQQPQQPQQPPQGPPQEPGFHQPMPEHGLTEYERFCRQGYATWVAEFGGNRITLRTLGADEEALVLERLDGHATTAHRRILEHLTVAFSILDFNGEPWITRQLVGPNDNHVKDRIQKLYDDLWPVHIDLLYSEYMKMQETLYKAMQQAK